MVKKKFVKKEILCLEEEKIEIKEIGEGIGIKDEDIENNSANNFKKILIIFLLFGTLLGTVALADNTFNLSLPESFSGSSTDFVPTPVLENIEPTPTPSPFLTKEEIKIKVLNGSGVIGQAGKIRGLLLEKGFQNIEVGNTEEEERGVTTILYNSNISPDLVQEILSEVQNIVGEIKEEESQQEIDILITTRKS